MKARLSVMVALLAGSAWWAFAKDVPPEAGDVTDLAFLTGSWKGTINGGEWEAVYTSPSAGEMLSANKEIRDGRVVMIEFEHFRSVDGEVVLTPFPYGKRSSTTFTLKSLDRGHRTAVFANPEHDFPQEITYRRVDDGRLVIDVVGVQNDAPLQLTIDLKRQS